VIRKQEKNLKKYKNNSEQNNCTLDGKSNSNCFKVEVNKLKKSATIIQIATPPSITILAARNQRQTFHVISTSIQLLEKASHYFIVIIGLFV